MSEVFFVYVLRSHKTGRRYVGSCQDIADRLQRHNSGQAKATKPGIPWKLIYFERFASRSDAVKRELYFKSGKGREELDRIEERNTQPA